MMVITIVTMTSLVLFPVRKTHWKTKNKHKKLLLLRLKCSGKNQYYDLKRPGSLYRHALNSHGIDCEVDAPLTEENPYYVYA